MQNSHLSHVPDAAMLLVIRIMDSTSEAAMQATIKCLLFIRVFLVMVSLYCNRTWTNTGTLENQEGVKSFSS